MLYNRIYDVTEFRIDHPGGEDVLLDLSGQGIEHDTRARICHQFIVHLFINHVFLCLFDRCNGEF